MDGNNGSWEKIQGGLVWGQNIP